ncbi:MAG: methyltransferase [Alphaproteobacteria bacterium]|nr:methyltransferase [Alphaproteobacteria bacterium]
MISPDRSATVLFEPFSQGILKADSKARVLFMYARPDEALKNWMPANITGVQPFKPYADTFAAQGYAISEDISGKEIYDLALVLVPKNVREAEYALAVAWDSLKKGGILVCAADNKAGGGRILKVLETLGLSGVSSLSRHKARCAWGMKSEHSPAAVAWLAQGKVQPIMEAAYLSQPGLFSWDRLDKGSAVLLPFITPVLQGKGADFGCGYGALSRAVLALPGVDALTCLDADSRALICCRENTGHDKRAVYIWADLTQLPPPASHLDFIVMNPPFHEGKHEASSIGQAFIRAAAAALKSGGRLLMVANTHLPYERDLQSLFSHVEKLHQESGFKIIEAVL